MAMIQEMQFITLPKEEYDLLKSAAEKHWLHIGKSAYKDALNKVQPPCTNEFVKDGCERFKND